MEFIKYQSLGNDFILLDWLDKSAEEINRILQSDNWNLSVQLWCQRRFGIGADGVLILRNNNKQIEGLIFNADGSQAERCLNGLRCLAHYLLVQQSFSEPLSIFMGDELIPCKLTAAKQIMLTVSDAKYQKTETIKVLEQNFLGHRVTVGNPHFVILQEVTQKWLENNGHLFEHHPAFPQRTNVEFVWNDAAISEQEHIPTYKMLVYERGCGLTLACGTGAAAVMLALAKLNKIQQNKTVNIQMLGGIISSFLDEQKNVIQIANADMVFSGIF